jgi:hypothetical protein
VREGGNWVSASNYCFTAPIGQEDDEAMLTCQDRLLLIERISAMGLTLAAQAAGCEPAHSTQMA